MGIALRLKKNNSNYGFLGIRDGELYTDYSSKDCTRFSSLEEAKPYINRLTKAGFDVSLFGFGKDSKIKKIYKSKGKKMEEKKFCLKSKAELDEIRKIKANKAEEKINEKADKRLLTKKPKLKSLATDIVDLGKGTAKSIGHALTGDVFRKKKANYSANEALEMSKKYLGEISDEKKARVIAKRTINNEPNDNWDSSDPHYNYETAKKLERNKDLNIKANKRKELDKQSKNLKTFPSDWQKKQMDSDAYSKAVDKYGKEFRRGLTSLAKENDKDALDYIEKKRKRFPGAFKDMTKNESKINETLDKTFEQLEKAGYDVSDVQRNSAHLYYGAWDEVLSKKTPQQALDYVNHKLKKAKENSNYAATRGQERFPLLITSIENFIKANKDTTKNESKKINEGVDTDSSEIKIFLTNLGKYNEGELVGEWVTLPVDDFQPILDKIGINDQYEEYFITDYEAPFEIGEYDNIKELNEIADEIKDFDETEILVLRDLVDMHNYDVKEAIKKVADGDYLFVEGDTKEDLAYSYIDMIGGLSPDFVGQDTLERYFDYEAYGRDLDLGGDYSKAYDDEDNFIGYEDNAGNVVDVDSEEDLAYYVIDDILGGISELSPDELTRYFDYEAYGRDLAFDFDQIDGGWVSID